MGVSDDHQKTMFFVTRTVPAMVATRSREFFLLSLFFRSASRGLALANLQRQTSEFATPTADRRPSLCGPINTQAAC